MKISKTWQRSHASHWSFEILRAYAQTVARGSLFTSGGRPCLLALSPFLSKKIVSHGEKLAAPRVPRILLVRVCVFSSSLFREPPAHLPRKVLKTARSNVYGAGIFGVSSPRALFTVKPAARLREHFSPVPTFVLSLRLLRSFVL